MKYIRILSIFTVISLLLAGTNSAYAQQAFAKLGTTLSDGHPALASLEHLQNSLNEDLIIQVFPDAQLGSAQQIMEGLQFGDIEMGLLPLESVSHRVPALAMLGLPYLFRDNSHQAQVLDGPLGKRLLETLNELNLVGLGFLETDSRYYLSKDELPLSTLDRIQGRSIAIICPFSESACHGPMYTLSVQSLHLMGAHPVILPLGALQKALESEQPDSIEYLPFIGMERQLKDSAFKTLTLPAHRSIPTVLVAGKRWFDSLTPQIQHAIVRTSNTLVRQQKRIMEKALQREHAALQAQGIEIAEEESGRLYEAMQTLYRKNTEDFAPEFEQFLQDAQKIGENVK